MRKTYVIGDIHGAYRALIQCLERSGFDRDNDKLIILGDVVDGWSESIEVIKELDSIKNTVYIIGNHDQWFIDFLHTGASPTTWLFQGGYATMESFKNHAEAIEDKQERERYLDGLKKFFNRGVYYYVDGDDLFVHGGFNWHLPIDKQDTYEMMWDRHMWFTAKMWQGYGKGDHVKDYDRVFIGHTTTSREDPNLFPVKYSNVWNLDQGAGWEGKLTIMNTETEEYWQSDLVTELYPGEKGRRG